MVAPDIHEYEDMLDCYRLRIVLDTMAMTWEGHLAQKLQVSMSCNRVHGKQKLGSTTNL